LAEFVILLLDNLSVFQLGDNPSNRKEYLWYFTIYGMGNVIRLEEGIW
jgi:hypothetical protein